MTVEVSVDMVWMLQLVGAGARGGGGGLGADFLNWVFGFVRWDSIEQDRWKVENAAAVERSWNI